MFILNKKSGVISEVTNKDVIKHCKKNSDEYVVAETAEELTGAAAPVEEPAPADPEPENATDEPEVEDSEGTEPEDEEPESTEETDYAAMNVADLRKVAKEKGIQGYANMNKETLIEVIKAHE